MILFVLKICPRVALKMAPLLAPLFLAVLLGTLVPCQGHEFVHPLSLISFHKATVKLGELATLEHCQFSIQPCSFLTMLSAVNNCVFVGLVCAFLLISR